MKGPSNQGVENGRDRFLPVASWALYDFANTIFYAVVVTRYLPLHILGITGRHTSVNWGFYPAMISAAFLAPWIGRSVGRRGVSKRTVIVLTAVCALFTAILAAARSPWTLVGFFALAQVAYQLALVPYNNLLPAVASPARMGRVSGLGVGLGYGGVILSLWVAEKLAADPSGETRFAAAYLTAAVLFALFTIPFLVFVPEKPPEKSKALSGKADFLTLLKDRNRRFFIIGNFLCADALNAILVFIAVFLQEGLGFDSGDILRTLIWLNIAALAGGIASGFLADLASPRRAMILAAAMLGAAVAVAQFSGAGGAAFWAIVLLGGPGVAGLWVAGRKWVVQLSPEGETGSLFGLYGMTNKLSLFNLIVFALLADLTGGYGASIGVILGSLALGAFFLFRAGVSPSPCDGAPRV